MTYILTRVATFAFYKKDAPVTPYPRDLVLCKAGRDWPVRWDTAREEIIEGSKVMLVPKDAMRYETEHGATAGALVYGGVVTEVGL